MKVEQSSEQWKFMNIFEETLQKLSLSCMLKNLLFMLENYPVSIQNICIACLSEVEVSSLVHVGRTRDALDCVYFRLDPLDMIIELQTTFPTANFSKTSNHRAEVCKFVMSNCAFKVNKLLRRNLTLDKVVFASLSCHRLCCSQVSRWSSVHVELVMFTSNATLYIFRYQVSAKFCRS